MTGEVQKVKGPSTLRLFLSEDNGSNGSQEGGREACRTQYLPLVFGVGEERKVRRRKRRGKEGENKLLGNALEEDQNKRLLHLGQFDFPHISLNKCPPSAT